MVITMSITMRRTKRLRSLTVLIPGAVATVFLVANLAPKSALAAGPAGHEHDVPVLVELFTSEGCSSCPPADALLGKLDELQPIPGALAIVLSEHVDYWNHDGWKDAYSSSFFTARQEDYAHKFGLKGPFTPQIVIDGAAQVNGSDVREVGSGIEAAEKRPTVPIRITSISLANPKTLRVQLEVDALPAESKAHKAGVFIAVALNHAQSHVAAGENKGRDISHVAVVESIEKVGTVETGKNFVREVQLKLKTAADSQNLRVIAYIQGANGGEVLGSALTKLPTN
jgi:hypothetical protein